MSLQLDALKRICHVISRQVNEHYRHLKLYPVVYHAGHKKEAIATEETDLLSHPAGRHASNILKRKTDDDSSAFLGIGAAIERTHLGLSYRSHLLGVIIVNADQYEDSRAAKYHLYHLAWQAMDLADIRERPEYRSKFKNGPMVPKRGQMNQAKANMCADVFSSVMMEWQGTENAISELARQRALSALIPRAGYRPEDFPFVVAAEATQFAFNETGKTAVPRNRMVKQAKKIAEEVALTFDDSSLRQWWDFVGPAQDMAWRGHQKEEILGAAVNTSEDPFIRATGLLVSEVTGIAPVSGTVLSNSYNAYAVADRNARLHSEKVEEVFEDVIARGVSENSSYPLIDVANEQNRSLTEGRVIGWCASALHAAARAFEVAANSGRAPDQAARLEFEGVRSKTSWDTVSQLGYKIIEQRRNGYAVTFSDIIEICQAAPEFAPFIESLEMTINDPAYKQQLEAVNELSPVAPSPGAAHKPAAELSHKPSPSEPALSPGLGGGHSSIQQARRKAMQQQQSDRYKGEENSSEES
jgi:hypothetical protein